jgi:hypothetical protein
VVACAAALLAAAAGCGGGSGGEGTASSSGAVGTGREVTRCLINAGGAPNGARPSIPKGFPSSVERAMVRGIDGDEMGLFLSHKPVFTEEIATGFDEIGEWHAEVLAGGRALLLSEPGRFTSAEHEVAVACIRPS